MEWRRVIAVTLLLAAASSVSGKESAFTIARRGAVADCAVVVIAPDADEAVRHAAKELKKYVKGMTGVMLTVATNGAPANKTIVLEAEAQGGLPTDSFRLKVEGSRLHVTGGGSRGVLYGVYELLERFGGCDWFAPWCENVPKMREFSVPGDLDISGHPAFAARNASWRQVHTARDRASRDFGAKMRFNSSIESCYGGPGVKYAKGLAWDNAIGRLAPPKEHFAEHPEWYCEIDGRRTGEDWQPCCMSTGLVAFVAGRVKELFSTEPDADAVSVAQMDCGRPCRCAACKACAEAEGSMSGPNIIFANAVAEEVEKAFPDKLIATFAYKHTRHPPKNIRPRRNVMVVLCTYECSFSLPFERSRHANTKRFCEDLKAWGGICRNLRVYDYCVNFRNYLSPFPNIYSLAQNYKLFRKCGTRWLGSQGCGDGFHAEFAELKCWLQSKLMWNPDQDVEPLIDRFMVGYYGAAAPAVRQYFNELYASFGIGNEHCPDPDAEPAAAGIYGENLPQLTEEKLERWAAMWREAEQSVKGDATREYNVRMGSLPVLYVRLKRLYERGYKTVWAAENIAPHVAGMEAIKPLAAELVARQDEANCHRRGFALAESYRTRHVPLMNRFRALADWRPPTEGCISTTITTNEMTYSSRSWRIPIREIAVDAGVKYCVRIRLRPKSPETPQLGVDGAEGFTAGLDVEWLPHAKGTRLVKISKDSVSSDWSWYDIGEYDFSELQKIPLPTMNGLCIVVRGNVELDCIELSRR